MNLHEALESKRQERLEHRKMALHLAPLRMRINIRRIAIPKIKIYKK